MDPPLRSYRRKQFIRFSGTKILVNLVGYFLNLFKNTERRIILIFWLKDYGTEIINNRKSLDNLVVVVVVVLSMFLRVLGLPIMDFQQEGWDGFSLSTARALFAGLTMLGLALYKRPLIFKRKEVVVSFLLGIFGYGWQVYCW